MVVLLQKPHIFGSSFVKQLANLFFICNLLKKSRLESAKKKEKNLFHFMGLVKKEKESKQKMRSKEKKMNTKSVFPLLNESVGQTLTRNVGGVPMIANVENLLEMRDEKCRKAYISEINKANEKIKATEKSLIEMENKVIDLELQIKEMKAGLLSSGAVSSGGSGAVTSLQAVVLMARPSKVQGSIPVISVNMVQHLSTLISDKCLSDYGVNTESSFADWARKFKDVIEASDVADPTRQVAIMKLKLSGWARQRFDELTVAQTDTVEHAIAALTPLFDTNDSNHLDFAKLKMFPAMNQHESVLIYAEKLEALVMSAFKGKTDDIKQQRLLEEFLDRLPFNVAFYVREKAPMTFKVALAYARKFEAICAIPPNPQRSNEMITMEEVSEVVRNEIDQLRNEFGGQRSYCSFDQQRIVDLSNVMGDGCVLNFDLNVSSEAPKSEATEGVSDRIKELEMRVQALMDQNKRLARNQGAGNAWINAVFQKQDEESQINSFEEKKKGEFLRKVNEFVFEKSTAEEVLELTELAKVEEMGAGVVADTNSESGNPKLINFNEPSLGAQTNNEVRKVAPNVQVRDGGRTRMRAMPWVLMLIVVATMISPNEAGPVFLKVNKTGSLCDDAGSALFGSDAVASGHSLCLMIRGNAMLLAFLRLRSSCVKAKSFSLQLICFVKVNGTTVRELIDTGARCSLVLANLLGIFGATDTNLEVISATGDTMPTAADITIHLNIDYLEARIRLRLVKMGVTTSTYEIVLGMNAVQCLPALTINYSSGVLHFDSLMYQLSRKKQSKLKRSCRTSTSLMWRRRRLHSRTL